MKINPRHRSRHRDKPPRISISQEEITADLIYPARRRPGTAGNRRTRGGHR
jgi:hypothetical protein